MEIQKWEYKCWRVRPKKYEIKDTLELLENTDGIEIALPAVFNEWGEMGWELVSVVHVGAPEGRDYIFKRPAQLPSDIVFTSDLKKTTEDNIPGGSA